MSTTVDIAHDSRLYRTSHGTFEDYCRERWGFTRMHASRLIGAAEVVTNLNVTHGLHLPDGERQARPLTVLEPEQQREVWQRAVETATNGKVTAERKAGELLQQLERDKGGDRHSSTFQPGILSEYRAVLTDSDIAPTTAHRWQTKGY